MIFVLVSHGDYAMSALKSVEMIVGKIENAFTVGLFEDMSKNDLYSELECIINKYKKDSILIMNDIYGGTPFNVTMEFKMRSENISVITGFNLMLLLSVFTSKSQNINDILEKVEKEKSDYIMIPKKDLKINKTDDSSLDL